MRYLHRPDAHETLTVQGRYDFSDAAGAVWASETWEHYRLAGSNIQAWRSECNGTFAGVDFSILTHALVGENGLERLKVRFSQDRTLHPTLSLTFDVGEVLVMHGGQAEQVDLPPVYGLVTLLPSLGRFALPFDLTSDRKELWMTYLLFPRWAAAQWWRRSTKFSFTPVGLWETTVQETVLKIKGWRLEVPSLAPLVLAFERNGTCVELRQEGSDGFTARLAAWRTLG